jgi:hypothetical protein
MEQIYKTALIAGVVAFMSGLGVCSGNNPLAGIRAERFDVQSGSIRTEACVEGGRDICSIHYGDYAVYKGYDFDSGVAAFKARIASENQGSIEIHLDSPTGALLGTCAFESTGGWQDWRDVTCQVDNSQAGVRDIYLIFRGRTKKALVNLSSFVFLKSIVVDLDPKRESSPAPVDTVDEEPQGRMAWGMPEAGFTDAFRDGCGPGWSTQGMVVVTNSTGKAISIRSIGTNLSQAFTPEAYINKTDTGGEWRTLAEASLAADISIESTNARPGIGFVSGNTKQGIYVVLNFSENVIEVWRKLSDDSLKKVKRHSGVLSSALRNRGFPTGAKFRLTINWSPYSCGLMVVLQDGKLNPLANFRTVIDLPTARHPLMICSGGEAQFSRICFDPTLDGWNFKWEWRKTPVLTPDMCNPAVWSWKDGRYYMIWRKFGQDTYHGVATSGDGVHWDRISDKILKCTGDMNVLVDPFGDGLVYATPGGENMPWFASDGANHFATWKDTGLKVGNIFGNSRIQELIDTRKYPQLAPVRLRGAEYRFIGFTENWTDRPQPHTVVLLSNTLTNWVLADPHPLIPPSGSFWGEKGNAIGSAVVLPDGNILVASCSCTFAGYTGAPEPSNVSAIVDGKEPWKVLRLGVLPDAPVSRENVWYQGPNFGTALVYDREKDTLFFYGGFHDYHVGMMRVRHFSESRLFSGK